MQTSRVLRFACLSIVLLSLTSSGHAEEERRPRGYNEWALEFPVDGGLMLMGSRMWRPLRYLDLGVVVGGGRLAREFDLSSPGLPELKARAESLIFPFVAPRLAVRFKVIALSVGYGAFRAKTKTRVKVPGGETLTGETSGWGTGFYSPLLALDVYDQKRDLVFGFGLGGFLGTTFPDLTAASSTLRVTTDANPLNTLTFHVKVLWADGRRDRIKRRQERDDDF